MFSLHSSRENLVLQVGLRTQTTQLLDDNVGTSQVRNTQIQISSPPVGVAPMSNLASPDLNGAAPHASAGGGAPTEETDGGCAGPSTRTSQLLPLAAKHHQLPPPPTSILTLTTQVSLSPSSSLLPNPPSPITPPHSTQPHHTPSAASAAAPIRPVLARCYCMHEKNKQTRKQEVRKALFSSA